MIPDRFLNNVNLSFDNGTICIKKAQKPRNSCSAVGVLNYLTLNLEYMDNIRCKVSGFRMTYKYVFLISFITEKYAEHEVKKFLGIKFVPHGMRQLFQTKHFTFTHDGPIKIFN